MTDADKRRLAELAREYLKACDDYDRSATQEDHENAVTAYQSAADNLARGMKTANLSYVSIGGTLLSRSRYDFIDSWTAFLSLD